MQGSIVFSFEEQASRNLADALEPVRNTARNLTKKDKMSEHL